MQFNDFMRQAPVRQRYWARSLVGWQYFSRAKPNAAHYALVRLEALGHVDLLCTQNVDGLHQAAGSRDIVDLHGRLDTVRCMRCTWRVQRSELQGELERRNPGWALEAALPRADGDVDLEADFSSFTVPECAACAGILKPDVVFFGETVPRERVETSLAAARSADAMLVAGSSLQVYSGYRFVEAAVAAGKPVVAVVLGRTRADDVLSMKFPLPCDQALEALADSLEPARRPCASR